MLDIDPLEFGIVVAGDTTSSGGLVSLATGSNMSGNNIALMGDVVLCPIHYWIPQIIIQGVDVYNNKKPIALHGHKISCNCTLIAIKAGSFAKIRDRKTLNLTCDDIDKDNLNDMFREALLSETKNAIDVILWINALPDEIFNLL